MVVEGCDEVSSSNWFSFLLVTKKLTHLKGPAKRLAYHRKAGPLKDL